MTKISFTTLKRYMDRLPVFMQETLFATTTTRKLNKSVGGGEASNGHSLIVETDPEDALLITAKQDDGTYRLILDVDGGFTDRVSSSKGHHHLFFKTRMTKEQHDAVILALRNAGVIEYAWAQSAIDSPLGATLRAPWVVKGEDRTMREQVNGDLHRRYYPRLGVYQPLGSRWSYVGGAPGPLAGNA